MASTDSTITDLFDQAAGSDEQSYYESNNDDKVGGFESLVLVPGELKSGFGYPIQASASAYKDTLISL